MRTEPVSAVEAQLRADLFGRLALTSGLNAVRVQRPFFQHFEVWPDLVLDELRVAVEYDSTGRHGLEQVGKREEADRRKDRALRAAGWEVIRLRAGKLESIGPHDLQLNSRNSTGLDRLVEGLRAVRGALLVEAYLR
jgi:very-short-patch-repair endonuclease